MNDVNDRVTYRDKTVPWSVTIRTVQQVADTWAFVTCDMPTNVAMSIGDTVAIDVVPINGVLRRYTVCRATAEEFEFVGYRTGLGPATPFLEGLSAGDVLHGQGPERPVKLPSVAIPHVAILGDETVMGTAIASISSTTSPVHVVIKSLKDLLELSRDISASSVTIANNDDDMKVWLTHFIQLHGAQNVAVFLVGEQAMNQTLRQVAFSQGIPKDQVATRTFWRPDKSGLE